MLLNATKGIRDHISCLQFCLRKWIQLLATICQQPESFAWFTVTKMAGISSIFRSTWGPITTGSKRHSSLDWRGPCSWPWSRRWSICDGAWLTKWSRCDDCLVRTRFFDPHSNPGPRECTLTLKFDTYTIIWLPQNPQERLRCATPTWFAYKQRLARDLRSFYSILMVVKFSTNCPESSTSVVSMCFSIVNKLNQKSSK